MKTRTPWRVLLVTVMTLALLPMLATFAPDGQVAGFTTAAPAAANKVWYQSVGRANATAPCEESSTEDLAAGWTQWAPSWEQWANKESGGFVCSRQITWAFDSVPPSSSGSGSVTCATGAGAANTCIVGNTGPGGGIVFYVNEANATGSRYMEVATTDYLTAIQWCDNSNLISASGSTVGTGNANTNLMIAGCSSGAANNARAYGTATAPAGSWFLPSLTELNALYAQRAVVGGFASGYYWSSSESSATHAYIHDLRDGFLTSSPKTNPYRVRPVRAF